MPKKAAPKRQLRKTYLREWRLKLGLTQEQAAARMEIDYTTLGRIERGLVPYSQSVLEAAAEAYGREPWELLNVNPQKDGQVVDFLDVLRSANDVDREAIIGFARGRISKQ